MWQAVVFDLDGTLVDSAPDIACGINRMLAGHGRGPLPVRAVEELTGEGASVLVARVLAAVGVEAGEASVARDTATYLRFYEERPCVDSELFEGAADTVAALRRAGVGVAVCTNKPEGLARTVLRGLGLGEAIRVVVGADTVATRKPDPAPLLHAIGLLGASPGRAVLVGDTAIDRECAQAAGVACLLVGWGSAARTLVKGSAMRLDRLLDLVPATGP